MAEDLRELMRADLPEQLYAAVSSVFQRTLESSFSGADGYEWGALPDTDPGHGEGFDAPAPLYNGRVYFDLWSVWQYGRKVEENLDELIERLAGPLDPEDFSLEGSICALQTECWGLRGDWYEAARYVANFRFQLNWALKYSYVDWDRWESRRAKLISPLPSNELEKDRDVRLRQLTGALQVLEDETTGSVVETARQIALFEQWTIRGSQLIEQLASIDREKSTRNELIKVYCLVRDLEITMARAVAVAAELEETVMPLMQAERSL